MSISKFWLVAALIFFVAFAFHIERGPVAQETTPELMLKLNTSPATMKHSNVLTLYAGGTMAIIPGPENDAPVVLNWKIVRDVLANPNADPMLRAYARLMLAIRDNAWQDAK